MKITRRHLIRLIKEENRRIRECGEMDMTVEVEPGDVGPVVEPVLETVNPMGDMLIEMEMASRALETVVESVQNAAHLCSDCGAGVAEQAPIVEAMATQAGALQEMLDAQTAVILENAGDVGGSEEVSIDYTGDLTDLSSDEIFGLAYEAGKQGM